MRGLQCVALSAALGSLAVGLVGSGIASGAIASVGKAEPQKGRASVVATSAGSISAVSTVPGSGSLWVLGEAGGVTGDAAHFIGHLVGRTWTKIAPPAFGGSAGGEWTIDATAGGTVWLGGAVQYGRTSNSTPAIWKLSGSKFVRVALPPLAVCACEVQYISASSASNVWAVGPISPSSSAAFVTLHFNGKSWSEVPFPADSNGNPFEVSTTGPGNAWTIDGTNFFHWNGVAWTEDGAGPANYYMTNIATASPTLAYATGWNPLTGAPLVMGFNGATWSVSKLKGVPSSVSPTSVTAQGKSAWVVGKTGDILYSDGGPWGVQSDAGRNVRLEVVDARSPVAVVAIGFVKSGSTDTTFIDSYNGHSWEEIPSRI